MIINDLLKEFSPRFGDFQKVSYDLSRVSHLPIVFNVDNASTNTQLELINLQSNVLSKIHSVIEKAIRDSYNSFNLEIFQNILNRAKKYLALLALNQLIWAELNYD